jgi:predicted RNA-binding protein YlqC (UPF0109 family)
MCAVVENWAYNLPHWGKILGRTLVFYLSPSSATTESAGKNESKFDARVTYERSEWETEMLQHEVQSGPGDTVSADGAAGILQGVVRSFVSVPDAVRVGTEIADDGTHFVVRVDARDLETVRGPAQRTLRSLRSLVTALGRRSGQRYTLDCLEQRGVAS